jgi:hypothetical protein
MRHSAPRRPSQPQQAEGPRVFTDDAGLLWSAVLTRGGGGAMEFSCIGDARRPVRAIAVDAALMMSQISDETLRAWLRDAPRIGRLT